jgi:hypothetical protein
MPEDMQVKLPLSEMVSKSAIDEMNTSMSMMNEYDGFTPYFFIWKGN